MDPTLDKARKDICETEEWASLQLLDTVERSLDQLYPGTRGLHEDLERICGAKGIVIEWNNQVQVPREDAVYLQLKYGSLIDHISD